MSLNVLWLNQHFEESLLHLKVAKLRQIHAIFSLASAIRSLNRAPQEKITGCRYFTNGWLGPKVSCTIESCFQGIFGRVIAFGLGLLGPLVLVLVHSIEWVGGREEQASVPDLDASTSKLFSAVLLKAQFFGAISTLTLLCYGTFFTLPRCCGRFLLCAASMAHFLLCASTVEILLFSAAIGQLGTLCYGMSAHCTISTLRCCDKNVIAKVNGALYLLCLPRGKRY